MMKAQKSDTKQLELSDVTIAKIAHINSLQTHYRRIEAKHQSQEALKILGRVFAIASRNHDQRSQERLLDRMAEIKKGEWQHHDNL